MGKNPRVMIAGVSSGGGKTTVVCGLLGALQRKGVNPSVFKCGPDFIDPMFHRELWGVSGYNLDSFFTPPVLLCGLLAKGAMGSDLSIIEGVMGYYDGLNGSQADASSWQLAKATKTPVILVLDAKGSSLSLGAQLKGFREFREDSRIQGFILNRCSKSLYQTLKPVLEQECQIPGFGYLPKIEEMNIESRHLGLLLPAELKDLEKRTAHLAKVAEETLEIEGIRNLGESAPPLRTSMPKVEKAKNRRVVLGVAKDLAFQFYYRENLELLESLGAKLLFFSPMRDSRLPEGIEGIYLGGGYPECYAKELAENKQMLEAVGTAAKAGMPILAEGGGFLYLQEYLEDIKGEKYPMAGVLKGSSANQNRLVHFGYITLEALENNLLCGKGEQIAAHEFHYWGSTHEGKSYRAMKPYSPKEWEGVVAKENIFAGFPHLYFWNNTNFAASFIKKVREFTQTGAPVAEKEDAE